MKLFQNHTAVCLLGEQGRKSIHSFFFFSQHAFATFSVATSKYKKAFLSSVGGSIPEERKCIVKEQLVPQLHTFRQSKAMHLESTFNLKAN